MSDKKIRILLVEDNLNACEEFESCIRDWEGFELVATTGKQSDAVKIVTRREVDAVVLDLELEEGHGIGVLEQLNERMVEKPFIIVSTNTQSDTVLHMVRKLGADFIIQKTNLNYTPNQILDFINKSFKFHAPVKERASRARLREYNRQNEDRIMKRKIATTLAKMGFASTHKGTSLLKDAIKLVLEAEENIVQVTKDIYPSLAQKHSMTVNSVEKNMRTAIEQAWMKGKKEIIEEYYPFPITTDCGRPTNMNFIFNMAEMIRY